MTLEEFSKLNMSNYIWIHFEGRNVENVAQVNLPLVTVVMFVIYIAIIMYSQTELRAIQIICDTLGGGGSKMCRTYYFTF